MTDTEPTSPAEAPAPAARGALGRIALILALVMLALGLVTLAVTTVLPLILYRSGSSLEGVGLALAGVAVARIVLALVPLVLGVIALARPASPHGAAGIAVGISGTIVLSELVGLLSGPLLAGIPLG